MKEESTSFSLESIEFIFRHPCLFICPFVIIVSLTFAYVSNMTLYYESKAVISFEMPGETTIDKKFIQRKDDLLDKILLGESIRGIVKEVWPEINEEDNPIRYNSLLEKLRNNIKFKYDGRDPHLLTISFIDSNPEICYKTVDTTIELLIRENKRGREQEIESGLAFLKSQVEFYKNKLTAIDEEIAKIKTELRSKYPELNEQEKNLVEQIIGEAPNFKEGQNPTLQKSIKYDEMLAELNLQLLEAQRKKEILERRLKERTYAVSTPTTQNLENDLFIKEYSRAIAEKELAMAGFISKGYTLEHPDVKRLQREIDDLKALKERRTDELMRTGPQTSEVARHQAEESLRAELANTESGIDILKDKIKLIEKYRRDTDVQLKGLLTGPAASTISTQATRLMELNNEKEINLSYYTDIRRRLEEVEIKSRLEKKEAGFNINILEKPQVPLKPIPLQNLPKMFMGLILGMSTGAGLAFLADSLNKPIRSSTELRELLGIPVIASIDRIVTLQEIRFRRKRRNIILVSLFVFVLLSKFLAKLLIKFK